MEIADVKEWGMPHEGVLLTKSDLQSMLQCPRKLWLEHHEPNLLPREGATLSRRAMDGVIVGEKARQQLGQGYLWLSGAEEDKVAAAARARQQLAAAPAKMAAEVPLVGGDLYARADALIPRGVGYVLRETKASTFPLKKDKESPDSPEEHHLNDTAIQAAVMEAAGLTVAGVELNFLNSRWRYPGNNDYSGLFRQLDVTAECNARKQHVFDWLAQAHEILEGQMPNVATGSQCFKPYNCPFLNHCTKLDPPRPEHPIELLPDSAGKALAKRLREVKGYTSILDPKPDELVGKQAALFRRIQAAHQSGNAVLEQGAAEAMKAIGYPRYFFDFEGIDFPVPQWKGVRPYEHVPFQWSCHIERSPGVIEHAEFLDLTGEDPSLRCIEEMTKVIAPADGGPIVVYKATYERLRLEDLALRHPAHSDLLQSYIRRLVDLFPIVKENFYDPRMQGSFSIKKVLKVVAPDISYEELAEIQEGTAAQVAYLLATKDPATSLERRAELDTRLRKYCRQDTWAMVEVAHFLAGSPRPRRPDAP